MILFDIVLGEPRMFQALLRRNPIVRVLFQHFGNEVFRLRRNSIPIGRVKRERLLHDIPKNFLVVVALERWVSAQKDEQDDAETPNIA